MVKINNKSIHFDKFDAKYILTHKEQVLNWLESLKVNYKPVKGVVKNG